MKLAKLFVELLTDVLAKVLVEVTAKILVEILVGVLIEVLIEILAELETRVEIRQFKEPKVFNNLRLSIVLLLAVCCWDSLKSYTSFSAQSLVESICALFLR